MLPQTGSTMTNNAPYVAAGGTVIAGLSVSEWGVIIGVFFIALTYFTSLYFHIKRDRKNK